MSVVELEQLLVECHEPVHAVRSAKEEPSTRASRVRPHLTLITDPAALEAELARVRGEYNTVRLQAGIGYEDPTTSITAADPRSGAPDPPGCAARRRSGSSRIERRSHDHRGDHRPRSLARASAGRSVPMRGRRRRHRRGRNPAPVRASERAPNTRQPVPTPRSALGQKSRPLYHELRNTAAPRSGSRDTHHVTRRGYSKVAR